ncbi:PQQ-binding-like beta-propeller repeat protein [Phytoactinopolyspora halotolerans]|uniref:PQQ-binding-like beta-propeller repeat protein n=1 Tax=Phytoactinopolyspora halotolerans TaxID=1981512 RepID=A0A6L9SGQ5_9ACTN|nr:PQQ-binding-like beta-propeller repeat protein [Phytoactinopolyspora halotolerans]NEE04323.1 PQQ-binding-like beta-propeller repeat protein [Phytoactinopolyspora halotolerans]
MALFRPRPLLNGALAAAVGATLCLVLAISAPGVGAAPHPSEPASPDPSAAGTFTDLGHTVTALTIMEGAYGPGPHGGDAVYAVVASEQAKLNVVDPRTRELIKTIPLPGASGAWGVTVASDGNVYIGTYYNGHLYRYEPEADRLTDLGQAVSGERYLYSLVPGPDGSVFGGTYSGAHLFSYSPADGFTDYGRMDPEQNYVRSVAYDADHDYVFAGIGARANLVRVDLGTGERQDFLPAALSDYAEVYDLDYVGGKLFVKLHPGPALAVLDPVTGEMQDITVAATGETAQTVPIVSRGTAPLAPDGRSVYYTAGGSALMRYDLPTSTVHEVLVDGEPAAVDGAGIGFGWLPSPDDPSREVLYALAGNYAGRAFTYDPVAGTLDRYTLPFDRVPTDLSHLHAGTDGDGKVYTSAYINGDVGVYDPATGRTTQYPRLGQAEGWAWHGGKLYIGTYPAGRLLEYDPARPWEAGTNPRVLFALEGDEQNRPTALLDTAGKLYVGTTPGYGEHGGALTVYDFTTGAHQVHRHIVQDQTISSLEAIDGTLFGGSSVAGGGGTDPIATEAKIFTWDIATGHKTGEFAPIPGAYSINALLAGPDGNLWGLADGTLFILDPETHDVLYETTIFTGNAGETDGDLILHPDEHIYGHSAARLFRVDPLAKTVSVLRQGGTRRLTLDPRGDFYLLHTGDGTNTNRLLRYRPPHDTCADSDVRDHVYAGDIDSEVPNRYAGDGCTINDLIHDDREWPNHGSFVRHVSSLAEDLVERGILDAAEADQMIAAAGRSDVG